MYDAFVDVWDCEELWVTLDRLNLNPPNVRNRSRSLIDTTDEGFDIELHWDVDHHGERAAAAVQGIVALTDTEPDHGGFQCSPELFRGSTSGRPGSRPTGTRSVRVPTAPGSRSSGPRSAPVTC
ncbi:hypothetical protein GCM10023238_06830 [Streptomyces heliomycini]